jgi:hypothetical protein
MTDTDQDQSDHSHKGKARAVHDPTENTPLLHYEHDGDSLESASPSQSNRTSLLSKLTTIFLTTLFASILLVLLLISLAYSYAAKASQLSNDDILNSGLVFRGPDAIDILNITEHGDVWIRVDGHIGFDAGAIIGVKPDNQDTLWLDAWKAIGRWGIHNLDVLSVALSSIDITSQNHPPVHLASIEASPFQVPLTANPPDDMSWLTPISLPIRVHPSHNASTWLTFARESWRTGYVVAQATIAQAKIQGGPLRGATWRSALRTNRSDVTVALQVKSMLHSLFIPIHLHP